MALFLNIFLFIKENKTKLISMNRSIDISKRLLLVTMWQMAALHTVAIIVVYSGNSPDTNPELLQMCVVNVNGERGRVKRKHSTNPKLLYRTGEQYGLGSALRYLNLQTSGND